MPATVRDDGLPDPLGPGARIMTGLIVWNDGPTELAKGPRNGSG
jgi:hypothetical protein